MDELFDPALGEELESRVLHAGALYRPPWPYCARCGYHVGDKTDDDGEVVCRFCRGHDHDAAAGTTVCRTCATREA